MAARRVLATEAGIAMVDATVALPDGVGIPEGGRRSGLKNLKRRAESLGSDSRHGPRIGENGGGTTVVWQAPHRAPHRNAPPSARLVRPGQPFPQPYDLNRTAHPRAGHDR